MSAFANMDSHVQARAESTKWWWLFLVTGILWLIVSLIVFRFNIESVQAVGILIACLVIVAGFNEFLAMAVTHGGWKWVHAILGGIFIVFGFIALFYPVRTFVAMASIVGWLLLFKGIFDIVLAFMTKSQNELWWLSLIAGIAQVLLAFWAAGYFGRRVVLLIAWVGAWALLRGVTEIVLAFQVRSLHKQIAGGAAAPADAGTPPPDPDMGQQAPTPA